MSRSFEYRPDIDGLRAIAITTVVACHAGLRGWSGGFVGVDVFFVISGFLITSLLLAEFERSGRLDLWDFYARRVRRLLPSLLTVIAATLALGQILLGRLNGERQALAKSAIASLLINSNHYFARMADGYFDAPSELQPFLHIWSLSLEEQFYLIWPPALAILLGAAWAATARARVLVVLALVLPASLLACVLVTAVAPSLAFYLMPLRCWELAAGALLALVPRRASTRWAGSLGVALGGFGLFAIGWAVAMFDRTTLFPGAAALIPVVGTLTLIAGNELAPTGAVSRLLSWRPVVYVGLVSYAWYLWHWPLIVLAKSVELGAADVSRDLALGGATGFALASLTYHWVEKPIRQSNALKQADARKTVRLGAVATLSMAILAGGVGAWAKFSPRSASELRLIAAKVDEPPMRWECNNRLEQPPRLPSFDRCLLGRKSGGVDAVLWGDSMADNWMPAMSAAAGELGLSIYQLTRDACPPLPGLEIAHPDPTQPGKCAEFQKLAVAEIERLHRDAGLRVAILSGYWPPDGKSMEVALRRTVSHLNALGVQVLLIGPTPHMPFRVPECLESRTASECSLSRADFESQRSPVREVLSAAARENELAALLDPTPYLCDEVSCPVEFAGTIAYRDGAHLTASAVSQLVPFARASLAAIESRPLPPALDAGGLVFSRTAGARAQ